MGAVLVLVTVADSVVAATDAVVVLTPGAGEATTGCMPADPDRPVMADIKLENAFWRGCCGGAGCADVTVSVDDVLLPVAPAASAVIDLSCIVYLRLA